MSFLNLLRNEVMKIFSGYSVLIIFLIMLASVIGATFIAKEALPEYNSNWKIILNQDIKDYTDSIENVIENPSEATKLLYEKDIKRLQFYLENDISPYNQNGLTFAKNTIPEFNFLLTIFSIIVTVGVVTNEYKWGTIKMMLIRPHQRWSILLSKYAAAIYFSLLLYVVFYSLCWTIGTLVFGYDSLNYAIYVVNDELEIIKELLLISSLKYYLFNFLQTVVFVSLVFMLATLTKNASLSVATGIVLVFTGNLINSYISSENTWAKFFIFSNDITYYLENIQGKIEGMTLPFSLSVNLIYLIVFILISITVFQKRDIN